jgi:hypothetical protein
MKLAKTWYFTAYRVLLVRTRQGLKQSIRGQSVCPSK